MNLSGRFSSFKRMHEQILVWCPLFISIFIIICVLVQPLGITVVYFSDMNREDEGIRLSPDRYISGVLNEDDITYRRSNASLLHINIDSPPYMVQYFGTLYLISRLRTTSELLILRTGTENGTISKWVLNRALDKYSAKLVYSSKTKLSQSLARLPDDSTYFLGTPYDEILDLTQDPMTWSDPVNWTGSIRGPLSFYVYSNSPYSINLTKNDLNQYEGVDVLNITVKNMKGTILYRTGIPDDGISTANHVSGITQEVQIDLPANEIVLVECNSTYDLRISRIMSDYDVSFCFKDGFHYLGSADGSSSPPPVFFYSYSGSLSLRLAHYSNRQSVHVIQEGSNQTVYLNKTSTTVIQVTPKTLGYIVFEKGDTVINTEGYTALSSSNFFKPYRIYQISDADLADYIIADYIPSVADDDGWALVSVILNPMEIFVTNDGTIDLVIVSSHGINVDLDWVRIEITLPPIWAR